FAIECSIDDGPAEQFHALNLFVANGRTSGGGIEVAPRAELADGRFDLVVIRDGSPLELATLTADYFLTSFLDNDLVVWRQCRTLQIISREPLPFSADGDVLGDAPARFETRPAALRAVRGP
ncbi:MAG: hypothetical protein JNG89_20265, partial [Planctomycetaceae bacterium]|nr:hypothetical protein [Planctomycetaceae bacterium]